MGNLCFNQHDTLGWSYHQQEIPVILRQEALWLALFVLLMGHPCGSLTIVRIGKFTICEKYVQNILIVQYNNFWRWQLYP